MSNTQTISDIYAIDKIIAIDPGRSGGIVVWCPNEELQVIKMPDTTREFSNILKRESSKTPNMLVVVEKVQMWKEDIKAGGKQFGIDKMMKNYNSMIASMETLDIAYWPVHPVTWQNGLYFKHKGMDKPERKKKYKAFAQKCFPDEKITLWNADALCIAEYTKRQIKNNFSWVLRQLDKNMLHNIRIVKAN